MKPHPKPLDEPRRTDSDENQVGWVPEPHSVLWGGHFGGSRLSRRLIVGHVFENVDVKSAQTAPDSRGSVSSFGTATIGSSQPRGADD